MRNAPSPSPSIGVREPLLSSSPWSRSPFWPWRSPGCKRRSQRSRTSRCDARLPLARVRVRLTELEKLSTRKKHCVVATVSAALPEEIASRSAPPCTRSMSAAVRREQASTGGRPLRAIPAQATATSARLSQGRNERAARGHGIDASLRSDLAKLPGPPLAGGQIDGEAQ